MMNQELTNKDNILSGVQSYDPSRDSIGNENSQTNTPNISEINKTSKISETSESSNHWEIRTEEQDYAFLPDQPIKDKNR